MAKISRIIQLILLIICLQRSTQNEGEVRLTNESSGLLEVFYDGEWGYVCDDGWNEVNGDVVCSILGYDGAISSSIGHYSSDVNYRLNYINCVGGEEDFLDCPYSLYTPNYCSVNEHVYISCVEVYTIEEGQVRLTNDTSGLLEVFYDGEWGYVCDDGWQEVNGDVVCSILGYDGAISSSIGHYSSDVNYRLNFINCNGNEADLLDCSYGIYTTGYCSVNEHIYISCVEEGQVRLTNDTSGLLEVFYGGEWGYVCDDGWTEVNGDVVCSILGYDGASSSSIGHYSSDVNYRLNYINCVGGEEDFLDCPYSLYTPNYCSVNEHVYISCVEVSSIEEGQVRLTNDTSGLLEVFYDGEWGYVCDDGWQEVNGDVVCSILGYDGAISSSIGHYSSDVNYRLNFINCNGNEADLLDCSYGIYTPNYCSVNEHVYISCVEEGQVRLTNDTSGLLEVFYDGEWGYVCDDGWTEVNGDVVCSTLGYDGAISSSIGHYSSDVNYKLNYINCVGGEEDFLDCPYSLYTPNYCSVNEHVYISCVEEGQVRLTNESSGLLEVFYGGEWGYVCDDGWTEVNGDVVCSILGYDGATSSSYGRYSSDVNYKLNYINCVGGEENFLDCPYSLYTPNYCSVNEHIYISCVEVYTIEEGQVRLTDESSGLLEVFYDGEWGYVCDDGWQEVNGDVVCSILGYDGAISSSIGHYSSDVNYRLNFINCNGNEADLLDCSYGIYTPNYCSVNEHVYISCASEGQVRLTDESSGLLEVFYDGEWGYVCDDGWQEVNGDVVCSILGYDGAISSSIGHYSSDVNYRLNFINCNGNEADLLDCSYGLYTPNFCSINEHVYISCSSVPMPTPQPLIGTESPATESPATESSGMIEIRVPSQNSYPTADIAVIYIISDKTNPPLFTTLSLTAAYDYISNGNTDDIVIQAALGGEYFNEDATYFLFTVGDGKQTNYTGDSYINYPLSAETSYELSYYILFYDENGDINPEFSMIGTSASVMTAPNQSFCVVCVVIPVTVALLILIIVLLVTLWCIRIKGSSKMNRSRNSPVNQIQLEKIDKKTTKDVENTDVLSNVYAVSEDVTSESVVKTDTD